MQGEESEDAAELSCSTILYRAILRKAVVDWPNRQVLPAAFMLRPLPGDLDGLSVGHTCAIPEYLSQFKKTFGVATMHTGRVRDLGLQVVVDDPLHDPYHASIKGLPRKEEDPEAAELRALDLARQARLLSPLNP
jgi:hypothetical protein